MDLLRPRVTFITSFGRPQNIWKKRYYGYIDLGKVVEEDGNILTIQRYFLETVGMIRMLIMKESKLRSREPTSVLLVMKLSSTISISGSSALSMEAMTVREIKPDAVEIAVANSTLTPDQSLRYIWSY